MVCFKLKVTILFVFEFSCHILFKKCLKKLPVVTVFMITLHRSLDGNAEVGRFCIRMNVYLRYFKQFLIISSESSA